MSEFNFFTPINRTGYGTVGENIVTALMDNGTGFNLFIKGGKAETNNSKILNKVSEDEKNFRSCMPSICHWHANDMHSFSGLPRIGFTVFELDQLSQVESNELDNCDEIIVPTQWAKKIILNNTTVLEPDEVHVLNFGCDLNKYQYHQKDYSKFNKDRIRLLNVGKFEVRKGHYNLAEALLKTKNTNLDLIAHWYNPFIHPNVILQYINALGYKTKSNNLIAIEGVRDALFLEYEAPNSNRIFLSFGYVPNLAIVNELARVCDIGVYPARAEGWNLPLHETMACGLPCITTNYSGHTEYVTKDNSILMDIDYDRLILANDGVFFRGTHGSWLYFTTNDLIRSIDSTVDNITNLQNIHQNLKQFREQYTWHKTAQQLLNIAESVQQHPF